MLLDRIILAVRDDDDTGRLRVNLAEDINVFVRERLPENEEAEVHLGTTNIVGPPLAARRLRMDTPKRYEDGIEVGREEVAA